MKRERYIHTQAHRALRARDLDDGRVHEAAPAELVHDEKDAVGEAQVPHALLDT